MMLSHAKRVAALVTLCLTFGWACCSAADAPATTQAAGKLVIKKAVYGDLPDGASIDVTKKVAEMVKDDALSVDATNDNFTDPVEGTVKKLKVDYTFNGAAKSKTVDEGQTLTIGANGE